MMFVHRLNLWNIPNTIYFTLISYMTYETRNFNATVTWALQ
jgi:hypothetical protein